MSADQEKPMPKGIPPRPTDAELAILRVIWERGPSTVREVQEELSRVTPTGYTTVLKLLQIMTEKGLVERDESQRTHVYRSRLPQEKTQRQLVRDLLDRAFSGSAQKLVMQALSVRKATPQELAEIRELLDRLQSAGQSPQRPGSGPALQEEQP
jgi:predicted transcriptional regulator